MEELKILVEMVAGLPAMATWMLAFFFAYKVIVVGSIYGVIRYVCSELFGWLKLRSNQPTLNNAKDELDACCISQASPLLLIQIQRIKGIKSGGSLYIHKEDVEWLRQAIDEKINSHTQPKA